MLVVVLAVFGVGASGAAPGPEPLPARGWCKARPNATWRAALDRGVIALSRTTSIVPMATGRDGRTFFAEVWGSTFSGVARVDPRTGSIAKIKEFDDSVNDQALGSFDGRWLVWREYHSLYNVDDFTVWAWDSRTDHLTQIGAAQRGPDGNFWPSQWRDPSVHDGVAAWVQGAGLGGLGDIHVLDLASGRDRIVRHGHVQGPFFVGNRVVWPESLHPDAKTVMRAVDMRTGKPTMLPLALRALRGVSALITDGTTIAYPNRDFTSLWWAPSPAVRPRKLFTSPSKGDHVDNSVQVAGRYILFGFAPHTYVVDTRTRRYLEISHGGWGRLDSRALVLLKPIKRKAIHALAPILFLPLASLPAIPRCG